MWSISSGIAHGVKEKIYILEVLGGFSLNDIVLMEYLWKSTFNEDRIESVKEPLLDCILSKDLILFPNEGLHSIKTFWKKGM